MSNMYTIHKLYLHFFLLPMLCRSTDLQPKISFVTGSKFSNIQSLIMVYYHFLNIQEFLQNCQIQTHLIQKFEFNEKTRCQLFDIYMLKV